MADDKTPPEIRALSSNEIIALEAALDLASEVADKPRPLGMEVVQRLYDDFLAEQISDNDGIIALGLSFGQELVRQGNLEWVRVTDEYGSETCAALPREATYAAPISMIQKRLKREEELSLQDLCQATLRALSEQAKTSGDR